MKMMEYALILLALLVAIPGVSAYHVDNYENATTWEEFGSWANNDKLNDTLWYEDLTTSWGRSSSGIAYILINYSVTGDKVFQEGSYWTVQDNFAGAFDNTTCNGCARNLSLEECDMNETIQLNMTSALQDGMRTRYQCYGLNGSWITLSENDWYDGGLTHSYIYEEALHVNRSNELNLTFSQEALATMIHSEGGNTSNLTSIFYYMTDIPEGKVSITFNDDLQLIEFNNEWDKDFDLIEKVYVTASPDKVQEFTVWDRYQPLDEANAYIYDLTAEDEFSLIWSSFTENQGKGSGNLVSGKTYRFEIFSDGYRDLTEDRYIVPGSDDTLNFVMVEDDAETGIYAVWTDCPSLAVTSTTCSLYFQSTVNEAKVEFEYILNGTTYNYINYTNIGSAEVSLTLDSTHYQYDINISLNDDLIGLYQLKFENTTSRSVQISMEDIDPQQEDIMLFSMIMLIFAGAFGALANRFIKGAGVYAFGITISMFGVVIGSAGFAGVGIGVIIIINIAGRYL